MKQYKLSYKVNGDTVEVTANTELELAASILNMERDVGMICYGVKIEQGDFNNKLTYSTLMDQMIHHQILKEDMKRKQVFNKQTGESVSSSIEKEKTMTMNKQRVYEKTYPNMSSRLVTTISGSFN